MSQLRRLGFFHFGSVEKADPVGSLEAQIAERPKSLEDTLLVLPEAFNTLGGYCSDTPQLDPDALSRLQTISAERRIAFVAGIVDNIRGCNSAYLVDGRETLELLTRKRTGGRPCLYEPCATVKDRFIPYRGVGITALICDDAAWTYGEDLQLTVRRVEELKMKISVMCIPACMRPTDSHGTATRWGKAISVVLANGDQERPSVLIHGRQEIIPERIDRNEIQVCDLEPEND
jgi:predicted amidohydrolase